MRVFVVLACLLVAASMAWAGPLDVPQNFQGTWGDGELVFTWDPVASATGYRVYRDGFAVDDVEEPTYMELHPDNVTWSNYWVTSLMPNGESAPSKPLIAAEYCVIIADEPPFLFFNWEHCIIDPGSLKH